MQKVLNLTDRKDHTPRVASSCRTNQILYFLWKWTLTGYSSCICRDQFLLGIIDVRLRVTNDHVFQIFGTFKRRVKSHLPSGAIIKVKGKGHAHNRPQRPKGAPGRLGPQIFSTFGTTRVVGRQPHVPAAFTPMGIPWYSFLEAESTPGHMVPSVATEKLPNVTPPGIDPETVRLVAQCLNHYATPGPGIIKSSPYSPR
jgi:hypothetical protein